MSRRKTRDSLAVMGDCPCGCGSKYVKATPKRGTDGFWTYRVVKHTDPGDPNHEEYYDIRSVYYNRHAKGGIFAIYGIGSITYSPTGSTPDDVLGDMELMRLALERTVLIVDKGFKVIGDEPFTGKKPDWCL